MGTPVDVANRVSSAIGSISRGAGVVAATSIFVMILITAYEVIMRYFLNRPTAWVTETAGYLLVLCALAGAVYTLYQRGHIMMELIFRRLSPRTQALLSIFNGLMAILYIVALTWKGWGMTARAYRSGWEHIGMLGVPQWWTYSIIPIGGIFIGLEMLRQIYHHFLALEKGPGGG